MSDLNNREELVPSKLPLPVKIGAMLILIAVVVVIIYTIGRVATSQPDESSVARPPMIEQIAGGEIGSTAVPPQTPVHMPEPNDMTPPVLDMPTPGRVEVDQAIERLNNAVDAQWSVERKLNHLAVAYCAQVFSPNVSSYLTADYEQKVEMLYGDLLRQLRESSDVVVTLPGFVQVRGQLCS